MKNRIIVFVSAKAKDIPFLTNDIETRYVLPSTTTFSQLQHVVRKRLQVSASDSLFLLTTSGKLLNGSAILSEAVDSVGHLQLIARQESTFG